jgi:GT2 family glycosyltransferase
LLGGHTINHLTHNPFSTASQDLIDYLYNWFNAGPQGPTFFTSNNMALPIDKLREFNGFDTEFLLAAGEDRDLCDHWVHRGLGTAYVPGAIVYHSHAMNLRTYLKQHFRYGQGAYRFHKTRARRGRQPVRIEPLRFYLNLLTYPLSQPRSVLMNLQISFLLGLSQVANIAGYFWERWIIKP